MKNGIYKGAIVEITKSSNNMVYIKDEFDDETCVFNTEVIEIPEGLNPEISSHKAEIINLKGRLVRLNDEYHKKRNSLHEMLMEARQKQISLVNKVLKNLK